MGLRALTCFAALASRASASQPRITTPIGTCPFRAFTPIAGPLEPIFVDESIIVLSKPADLLSVPGRIDKDSLATRAAVEYGVTRIDKMVVHRLDMATSGVMVFARNDRALGSLHEQFRQRRVRKRYVAVVHGVMPADEGEIDVAIRKNLDSPPLQCVDPVHGKPSLTGWRVIGRGPDRTRLELVPHTGRSHQLRLHLKTIGFPILGDYFYGSPAALALAERCLLHAETLTLAHPETGKTMIFRSPCPF